MHRLWPECPGSRLFGVDFEIDRGRSSLEVGPGFLQPGSGSQMSSDPGTASWVRIRREFSVQALFSTVQYSFSVDPKNMVETLVFRVRDPKDLLQVSIEDSASAVTHSCHHADQQHAGQSHQAGALRQIVGGAGAVLWDRRQVRRRTRARTSRCFRAPRRSFQTIGVCWGRELPCPLNWSGSAARRRSKAERSTSPKKPAAKKK